MIIEFAGLPKSGKSSNIAVIRDYFSRSGYRTKLVAEGARTCPFSNKHRIEFACWTANQAMNAVLEARFSSERESIILQDRGVFDALAFIKLLALENWISETTAEMSLTYLADQRWTGLIDLIILLDVTPEIAIQRDMAARLNAPTGIITNLVTMNKLLVAYEFILEQYQDRFLSIERIDSTKASPLEITGKIIQIVQQSMPNSASNPFGRGD